MRVYIVHQSDCIGIRGVYLHRLPAIEYAAKIAEKANQNGRNYVPVKVGPLLVAKWQDGGAELFVESHEVIAETTAGGVE
jgi:hypothetical protein